MATNTLSSIDPKTKATLKTALLDVLGQLQPFKVSLTKDERKSLSSKAMGRESLPFAEQAAVVLTDFKDVLSRSITDDMIAEYPKQLETFDAATDLCTTAQSIVDLLTDLGLVTGVAAMTVARKAYKNVQDDKGKTPGLRAIALKLAARFAHKIKGKGKGGDDDTAAQS